MNDYTIPIYTADIEMSIVNNTVGQQVLEVFALKNIVVKGFNIEDIKIRMKDDLDIKSQKIKKLGKNQVFKCSDIRLLKQHGYGTTQS